MQLIDGKLVANEIKKEIATEVEEMIRSGFKKPHLAAILVGHDGASETYVNNKVKACAEIGFNSTLTHFEENISEDELIAKIVEFNNNEDIDGFIVQLPLPPLINEQRVIETINFRKDVDGFHPMNLGKLVIGLPCYLSATPSGILDLIRYYKIETRGKHCVVIGRSNIVGKPISILLGQKTYPGDCTVSLCHSRTTDLASITASADILIAAIGIPDFIKGNMVKEGAVIIDVGTTRVPSELTKSGFKLKGDVKFDEVAPKCSYITPVPGGVGPMTIVSLLKNTLKAAKKEIYK